MNSFKCPGSWILPAGLNRERRWEVPWSVFTDWNMWMPAAPPHVLGTLSWRQVQTEWPLPHSPAKAAPHQSFPKGTSPSRVRSKTSSGPEQLDSSRCPRSREALIFHGRPAPRGCRARWPPALYTQGCPPPDHIGGHGETIAAKIPAACLFLFQAIPSFRACPRTQRDT